MSERIKIAAKTTEIKREKSAFQGQKPGIFQSPNSPISKILSLQRTIGNQAVQRLFKSGVIQAKLKIRQPVEMYEREANQVTERVMRMPEQRVHIPVVGTLTLDQIQRENPYTGTRVQEIISAPSMVGHMPIPIPYNQLDTGSVNVFHAWRLGAYTPLPPHVVVVSQMPEFNSVRFYHLCVNRISGLGTGSGPHLYILYGRNLRFQWSNRYPPTNWLISKLRTLLSQPISAGP